MSNMRFIDRTSQAGLFAPRKGAGGIAALVYHAITSRLPIQDLARRLIRLCELAYGQRDVESLERASAHLCNLPLQSAQDAGRYFRSIVIHRKGDSQEALLMLAEMPGPRATQTAASIYYELGEYEKAVHLSKNVSGGVVAVAGAAFTLSAVASAQGNHTQALELLSDSWPAVKAACLHQPHLWPLYNNEVAFELLRLGQLEHAAKYSSIAVASPLIEAYPEWQQTREQIREREQAPVSIAVFAPPSEDEENRGGSGPVYYRTAAPSPARHFLHVWTVCIFMRLHRCNCINGPPFHTE
jgi:hypothetical protein